MECLGVASISKMRYSANITVKCATLLTASGFEDAGSDGRSYRRPCVTVGNHTRLRAILSRSWRSRFCIAPLDVLKIRLQLRIYSLSDPIDAARKARYGTVATFKNILRDEGATVRIVLAKATAQRHAALICIGFLERQSKRRTALHKLRRTPIFHLPPHHPNPPAFRTSQWRRSFHIRCRRRSISDHPHLPARSPPHPLRSTRPRQSLC